MITVTVRELIKNTDNPLVLPWQGVKRRNLLRNIKSGGLRTLYRVNGDRWIFPAEGHQAIISTIFQLAREDPSLLDYTITIADLTV